MKKEEILKMTCMVLAGMLSNPVMSGLCTPIDSIPRRILLEILVDEITSVATQKVGLTIEE